MVPAQQVKNSPIEQLKSAANRNAASAKVPGEATAGGSKEQWEAGNVGRTFSGNNGPKKGEARGASNHQE